MVPGALPSGEIWGRALHSLPTSQEVRTEHFPLTGSQAEEKGKENHLGVMALLEALGPVLLWPDREFWEVLSCQPGKCSPSGEREQLLFRRAVQARLEGCRHQPHCQPLGLDGETASPDVHGPDPAPPVMKEQGCGSLASR